jgi:hypothetical protein
MLDSRLPVVDVDDIVGLQKVKGYLLIELLENNRESSINCPSSHSIIRQRCK